MKQVRDTGLKCLEHEHVSILAVGCGTNGWTKRGVDESVGFVPISRLMNVVQPSSWRL